MSITRRSAPLALAALLLAPAAGAQNLLVNGGFSGSLAGWSRAEEVSYEARTSDDGYARIEGSLGIVGKEVLAQCVAVTSGERYSLIASSLKKAYTAGASSGLSVRVTWHESAGCDAPLRAAPSLDFSRPAPEWQEGKLASIEAPDEARSAAVSVVAYSSGPAAVTILIDQLIFQPLSPTVVLTIPTVASVRGANGETFQTDLWVMNRSFMARKFALRFRCEGNPGCGNQMTVLNLAPNETRFFGDALKLATAFYPAGAFEILYDAREGALSAFSRVSTVNPERPGNGAAIPALPAEGAVREATYLGVSGDVLDPRGPFRVNAGAYNPSDEEVRIAFEVVDGDGRVLGVAQRDLRPHEWKQIDDLFGAAGVVTAGTGTGYVTFRSPRPVFPFLIAIDNRSGDPTYVPPAPFVPYP